METLVIMDMKIPKGSMHAWRRGVVGLFDRGILMYILASESEKHGLRINVLFDLRRSEEMSRIQIWKSGV